MLILLIRSHCKICPLPTIRSCVFVLFATDKLARSYCRQCAHFKTGTNEQNQYFSVLRQKVSLCIHIVVLQSGLPSLDGKLKHFVTKKWKKRLPNLSQTDSLVMDRVQTYWFHVICLWFQCSNNHYCTDDQKQVYLKPAGQPEQASLNQCQLIAQNWCVAHAQLKLEIRFLCNVTDTRALIGPNLLVPM